MRRENKRLHNKFYVHRSTKCDIERQRVIQRETKRDTERDKERYREMEIKREIKIPRETNSSRCRRFMTSFHRSLMSPSVDHPSLCTIGPPIHRSPQSIGIRSIHIYHRLYNSPLPPTQAIT